MEKIEFPRTALPVASITLTPAPALAVIRLPAPAAVPPIVFPLAPFWISTPGDTSPGSGPFTFAEMSLPCTSVPVVPPPSSQTPGWALPRITFPSPAEVPPTTVPAAPWSTTPAPPPEFPTAPDPAASVPIRLPRITVPLLPTTLTPAKSLPLITFPRIALLLAPLGSMTPAGGVTVAVLLSEPVALALMVPVTR